MDPNEALRQLREALREIRDGMQPVPDEVDRLAEHAEALDEWLSRGGFLPDAWARTDQAGRPVQRRAIDVYDDELAVMHERITEGGMAPEQAARVTAGYSRKGVTPERLVQLYAVWSALLATAGAEAAGELR